MTDTNRGASRRQSWAAALLCLAVGAGVAADEAPVRWDLSEIYADERAWEAARVSLAGESGGFI